jgi:hypothetical protein
MTEQERSTARQPGQLPTHVIYSSCTSRHDWRSMPVVSPVFSQGRGRSGRCIYLRSSLSPAVPAKTLERSRLAEGHLHSYSPQHGPLIARNCSIASQDKAPSSLRALSELCTASLNHNAGKHCMSRSRPGARDRHLSPMLIRAGDCNMSSEYCRGAVLW